MVVSRSVSSLLLCFGFVFLFLTIFGATSPTGESRSTPTDPRCSISVTLELNGCPREGGTLEERVGLTNVVSAPSATRDEDGQVAMKKRANVPSGHASDSPPKPKSPIGSWKADKHSKKGEEGASVAQRSQFFREYDLVGGSRHVAPSRGSPPTRADSSTSWRSGSPRHSPPSVSREPLQVRRTAASAWSPYEEKDPNSPRKSDPTAQSLTRYGQQNPVRRPVQVPSKHDPVYTGGSTHGKVKPIARPQKA